jgi:hypothetical protein
MPHKHARSKKFSKAKKANKIKVFFMKWPDFILNFRQSKRPLPTNPKRGLAEQGHVEQVGRRRLSAAFPSVMAS